MSGRRWSQIRVDVVFVFLTIFLDDVAVWFLNFSTTAVDCCCCCC